MPGRWETSVDESYDFNIKSNNYEQPPPEAEPSAPRKQAPQSGNKATNVCVLVTKLKEGTTLGQINATFKAFGELEDIAFGETQSEAVIQFTYPEGAAAALNEEVIHCAGKTVFVRPYHSNVVPPSKPAPSKASSYHAPQHHSSHQQHHYPSAPPKQNSYQQAPPKHNPYEGGSSQYNPYEGGSSMYGPPSYHKPAPSKQYASPPPSSNHYPPGYYPAEPSYSSHSHEGYHPKPHYHQSHPPKQSHSYQQAPPPQYNPYEGSSHYPSGYGGHSQPQKTADYSSKSFGYGGGASSSFTKNTGPKVGGVTSENVEKQKFVDLCFMFDATGSMGPHIALTVQSIKDIVAKAQERMKNRIIRLSFVVYRDYPEAKGAPVVEHLNFTQNVDHFMTSLSKIQATGGGDECEDVVSGLLKVQELEWSSNTRILFWIADAPCHGEQYHDGRNDTYAKEPPKERPAYSEKELLEKLKFLNIRNFFFLKINSTTDKMVGAFKGMFDSQGFELKQEAINGNKAGFVEQVVGSVMYSVNFHTQHY